MFDFLFGGSKRREQKKKREARQRKRDLQREKRKNLPEWDDELNKYLEPQKEDELIARMFEVKDLEKFESQVMLQTMVNEDYYLPDEELVEYYLPGACIRELDPYIENVRLHIEKDPENGGRRVRVLINGFTMGFIDPVRSDYAQKMIREGRVTKVQAVIGGGRYKQLAEDDDRFDWEKLHAVSNQVQAVSNIAGEETIERVEVDGEPPIIVRDRHMPIFIYVCLTIKVADGTGEADDQDISDSPDGPIKGQTDVHTSRVLSGGLG